jgi:hypothetical protein
MGLLSFIFIPADAMGLLSFIFIPADVDLGMQLVPGPKEWANQD